MIKTIRVTEKDYLNFTNYAFKRLCTPQPKGGKGSIKNMIIWCILTIAFMFLFQIDSISLSSFHWPSALIVALPFTVFIVAYYMNMRKLRQSSIPNQNGLMLGEKTIEFGTDGITEINPLGNCFYKWESVESVEDNSGDLYIFLDKLLALIIPAASFTSDIEKAELQSIVKKYV
ncbi:YcxB family protein [Rheinheimera sp. UJ51]|uniref:YcxB family protein n=1 Tax=Rheinheimera sp. UJ51 TaxID=2892446 RepID=UPI001E4E5A81|nr:YcxB family protein [Rheinheimera sp. UJ51]MCC5453400.1 YcxB family protein [Rheinheimera sp. UJ51]